MLLCGAGSGPFVLCYVIELSSWRRGDLNVIDDDAREQHDATTRRSTSAMAARSVFLIAAAMISESSAFSLSAPSVARTTAKLQPPQPVMAAVRQV